MKIIWCVMLAIPLAIIFILFAVTQSVWEALAIYSIVGAYVVGKTFGIAGSDDEPTN